MLIKIGSGAKTSSDLVDLLLECHGRIRSFVAVARRLGETETVPAEEIRAAATRVRRYFTEALPLHVADEEESIVPRLRGRDVAVDAALGRMEREHAEHAAGLASLVALCTALEEAPERHAELRASLAETATSLERDFLCHLESEEAVVFPALRSLLPEEERSTMMAELRARRDKRPPR